MNNIVHLHRCVECPPADYSPLDYIELEPLTFGERLVLRVRSSAKLIGVTLYILGVLVAMYFAFSLGRGAL